MDQIKNINQDKNKPVEVKTPNTFRQKVDNFLNFKNSPILKALTKSHHLVREQEQELLEVDLEQHEDQNLLTEVQELRKSGIPDKFIKYADRKFALRNDIILAANDQSTNTKDIQRSYIYGKYERFLTDSVGDCKHLDNRVKLALFKISDQSELQQEIKEMPKEDFISKYFPGVKYSGDLPEFQLQFHPLAVHITSADDDFIQNLKVNGNFEEIAKEKNILKCGGFYTEIDGLKIITESTIPTNQHIDIQEHELFHAEMSLQNPKDYLDDSHGMSTEHLLKKISESDSTDKISKLLNRHISDLKLRILEEVMAFFSENNHDFNDEMLDCYIQDYGLESARLEQELAQKSQITPLNKAGLINQFKMDIESMRQPIHDLKDALDIMQQKGYPKDWILNSFGSMIKPPAFLDKMNPKALAISLPEYDSKATQKQASLFDKISDRHQRKLEVLKNNIELPMDFIDEISMEINSENFFKTNGVTSKKYRVESLIRNLRHGPQENCTFLTHNLSMVLHKYGDNQSTRQAIISKIDKIVDDAKQKSNS